MTDLEIIHNLCKNTKQTDPTFDLFYKGTFQRVPSFSGIKHFDECQQEQVDVIIKNGDTYYGVEEKELNFKGGTLCHNLPGKPRAVLLETKHTFNDGSFKSDGWLIKPKHPDTKYLLEYDTVLKQGYIIDYDMLLDLSNWNVPEEYCPNDEKSLKSFVEYEVLEEQKFLKVCKINRNFNTWNLIIPLSWIKNCIVADIQGKKITRMKNKSIKSYDHE